MANGFQLAGRTAAITGAGGGIGRALCRSIALAGARALVAIDKDSNSLAETAVVCRDVAPQCAITEISCDVSNGRELRACLHAADPIDLFCANAGALTTGDASAPDGDWQHAWEVNVMQLAWGAQVLVPRMKERGGGALMVMASAAGVLTQLGSAPYTATKHAAVGLAEWLAISHWDDNIVVCCVCPQGVRTAMATNMLASETDRATRAAVLDGMLEPDEVADEALCSLQQGHFLCMPGGDRGAGRHVERKGSDRERWLEGMRRLQAKLRG